MSISIAFSLVTKYLYYFISDSENKHLETVLNNKMHIQNHIKDIKETSEIIFDSNILSYKEIIQNIEHLNQKNKISFKILYFFAIVSTLLKTILICSKIDDFF